MSLSALAQAVRDTIQAAVTVNGKAIDAETCELTFRGQPKPGAGQVFIGIHTGSWQGISGDNDLAEEFGVNVTVTFRLGDVPEDRFGIALFCKPVTGLDAFCRGLVTLLHKNNNTIILANTSKAYGVDPSGYTGGHGFFTPLWFLGGQGPDDRDYKWFTGGQPAEDETDTAQAGVSVTLQFGRAQRCQQVPGAT